MGRLTLAMMLSFAQFEREIAVERIRDKIAASKAKGMWMGGNVPLGYDARDRKLAIHKAEAKTVRMLFRRYAEHCSVTLLQEELDRQGIRSKQREGAGGRIAGGRPFPRGILYLFLQNQLYHGEVEHRGNVYPGQNEAIVDTDLRSVVQDKLAANRKARDWAVGAKAPSLLSGLIFDGDGHRMTPTYAVKKGRRYRYYVSTALINGRRTHHERGLRVPAGDVEALVLDRIFAYFASEQDVGNMLSIFGLDAATLRSSLKKAHDVTHGGAASSSFHKD